MTEMTTMRSPTELVTEVAVKTLQLAQPGTELVHPEISDIVHMAVAFREVVEAWKAESDDARADLIVQWMKTTTLDTAKIENKLAEDRNNLKVYATSAKNLRDAKIFWFNDNIRFVAAERAAEVINMQLAAIKRSVYEGERDMKVAEQLPAWKHVPAVGIKAMLASTVKPDGFQTLLDGFHRAYIGGGKIDMIEQLAWVEYLPEVMAYEK